MIITTLLLPLGHIPFRRLGSGCILTNTHKVVVLSNAVAAGLTRTI
jgi:hypothetical protein